MSSVVAGSSTQGREYICSLIADVEWTGLPNVKPQLPETCSTTDKATKDRLVKQKTLYCMLSGLAIAM